MAGQFRLHEREMMSGKTCDFHQRRAATHILLMMMAFLCHCTLLHEMWGAPYHSCLVPLALSISLFEVVHAGSPALLACICVVLSFFCRCMPLLVAIFLFPSPIRRIPQRVMW